MDELPPNFLFGSYVVRHVIGRGGMARVYRAEHATLRKAVALKVMDAAWIGHAAGTQRFVGEARAAAAVKHRNVVDIVDVGVWQERPYIVMELLDGVDLERHLANTGPLSEPEVVALALPIIAGMTAVHEAGIVHRDLKPSNIFLTSSNEGEVTPKVLDFGISRLSEHLQEPGPRPTGTREIIGTPTYMSPEGLDGVRELGPAADQYSLGVVLYQCAVGKPPFQGDTLLQLLRSIALGAFPSPRVARPQLSATLDAIISRAMRVNAHERFPSLRDLGRALWPLGDERTRVIWARYFGDAPPDRLAQSSLERSDHVALVRDRTRGSGRRSRLALGVALGISGALLATLGWRWLSSRADPSAERPSASEVDPRAAPKPLEQQVLSAQPAERSAGAAAPAVSPISNAAPEAPARARAARPQRAARSERAKDARRSERSSRAAASPAVAAEPARERSADPDLATLFELDGARQRPSSAPASEGELRSVPDNEQGHSTGINGAPILD